MNPTQGVAKIKEKIAAARLAGNTALVKDLENKKSRYAKKVEDSYRQAGALMLEAQADFLRVGNTSKLNEVAEMYNKAMAEFETFHAASVDEKSAPANPIPESGTEVRLADYDDPDIEKHAQYLGAAVVTRRTMARSGNAEDIELSAELSPLIAEGIDELLELEAKAKTSRSSTQRAYRKMKRKRPARKQFMCCDAPTRRRSKSGRSIWSTTCWYKSLKTKHYKPMFRSLGDAKKHPKPRVITMGGKKMRKCTGADEKKFAMLNAKLAKTKAKKGGLKRKSSHKKSTKAKAKPKAKVVKAPPKPVKK